MIYLSFPKQIKTPKQIKMQKQIKNAKADKTLKADKKRSKWKISNIFFNDIIIRVKGER